MSYRSAWRSILSAWSVCFAAVPLMLSGPMALAESVEMVVFDSIPLATTGGIGSAAGTSLGERVNLAGEERFVTKLEVRIRLGLDELSGTSPFQFTLYDGTGDDVFPPGSLLWQGPGTLTRLYPGGGCCGPAIVGASVPNVHVPDTIVWMLTQTAASGQFLYSTIDNLQFPPGVPLVGSDEEILRRLPNGNWSSFGTLGGLAARISATVPEPMSFVLLCLASAIVSLRRTR